MKKLYYIQLLRFKTSIHVHIRQDLTNNITMGAFDFTGETQWENAQSMTCALGIKHFK